MGIDYDDIVELICLNINDAGENIARKENGE